MVKAVLSAVDRAVTRRLFRFRQAVEHLPLPHFSVDDRADLNLIIEELGRNAIEWGNQNDARKSMVLALRWSDSWLVFQVGDQGPGFIPDQVPDPRNDPIAHLEHREAAKSALVDMVFTRA